MKAGVYRESEHLFLRTEPDGAEVDQTIRVGRLEKNGPECGRFICQS